MMRLQLAAVAVAAGLAQAAIAREVPVDPPVRNLGRVFAKLKAGEPVAIAYFGGSITAADGYRAKTLKWFRDAFPKATIREINAAMGGTGSDLGAFRCQGDVIAHKPDLVFVEFNINDGSPTDAYHRATLEGIVRQLWDSETKPEVVFLYTTDRALDKSRVSQQAVAVHYGVPRVDLQPALIEALLRTDLPKPTPEQLRDPKLDWSQPGQVFMGDSVHPNDLGHTIYAETIIAFLKSQVDAQSSPPPTFPPPLVSDAFAHIRMVPPSEAKLTGDWEVTPPAPGGRYSSGIVNARKPGDALEFPFEGTAIGLFLDVQKDGGKFSWTIDDGQDISTAAGQGGPSGRKHGVVDTAPGPFFPRHHYTMLSAALAPGRHTLTLKVVEERDPTSTGHRLLFGYFLVGGVPAPSR